MSKKYFVLSVILVLCLFLSSVSYAALQSETLGTKFKNFWSWLFRYPANVAHETLKVTADAAKSESDVVANEFKTLGDVGTGYTAKSEEIITGPIKGTADTAYNAVKAAVQIPGDAAVKTTEQVYGSTSTATSTSENK